MTFHYETAFSRNLGLVQPEEQQRLRQCRVAIPGLGGVGGAHCLTLARLGLGHFRLADMDQFEVHNFNRQVGALMSTVGRPKAEVMAEMVRDINPEAEVEPFIEGITPTNIGSFFTEVDIVIDGLDFFAIEARSMMYREAQRRHIPIVAAGPIGASAAYQIFLPGRMTWHAYFAIDLAKTEAEKYLLFAIGNAPAATHRPYMDSQYVSLDEKRGPSLSSAVSLCTGVAGAETMKILLKRGRVFAAPWYHQFDPYRNRYIRRKLRWGNRGPLQRLKFVLSKRYYLSGEQKNKN